MTPAAREARERVLRLWPWAEFAEYTENGKTGVMLWDGVQFDASGYLGSGDTEDAAWLDADRRLEWRGGEG